MAVYLVGGAVRDQLLGYPVKDRDWVVVGELPETLAQQGYQAVGKDFPVFLHPKTHEEYALARTERKVGQGYRGFECHADPDVTLEQDLQRRDLTLNAMAQDASGNIIDPFGGQQDIEHQCLRHVSSAFSEDPVRALRIARFSAKLPTFTIADETWALLKEMRDAGEFKALMPARIWQELTTALTEIEPQKFFDVLFELDVLETITHIWTSTPNCSGMNVLPSEAKMDRFLWCCIDQDVKRLQTGFERLVVPQAWRTPALWMAEGMWKQVDGSADRFVECCTQMDAWRRPDRFQNWLNVCQAHPVIGIEFSEIFKAWLTVFLAAQIVDVAALQAEGHAGAALGQAILARRLALASQALHS